MNKWPRCKDCVRDNYLREPVCQTCVAGSNFLPRGRSKIYYESVQEMNQPPAAYRAMVQALSLQSGRTSILRKRISDAPWPSSYMTTSSKR